jgi:5-methyltetrahydropteroyltriglutamate--homocysteine methyltransferase
MFDATCGLTLPTTITGSRPRPSWFTESRRGRAFQEALGDSRFREQYLDAVSCIVREREHAGLDIATDGDSRFDLTVGGKPWSFHKATAINLGANIVRGALGLPEVEIPSADPRYTFSG